jgi:hypothetical protein
MIVFKKPINNKLNIEIFDGGKTLLKAYFLSDKKTVEIINAGKNKQNNNLYNIAIPENYTSNQPFVIVLETKECKSNKETYKQART